MISLLVIYVVFKTDIKASFLKVHTCFAGSIPGVIGYFNLPNPSSRATALGSTQPLIEMSTSNLLEG
jgi:hypothetical protein